MNIYDTINQLERDLRQQEEYLNLKAAMADVVNDEIANELYQRFRQMQMNVQTQMQMGQEISEETIKEAQALEEELTKNELISRLLDHERQLNQIVEEVNRIITQPIYEIYQQAE